MSLIPVQLIKMRSTFLYTILSLHYKITNGTKTIVQMASKISIPVTPGLDGLFQALQNFQFSRRIDLSSPQPAIYEEQDTSLLVISSLKDLNNFVHAVLGTFFLSKVMSSGLFRT